MASDLAQQNGLSDPSLAEDRGMTQIEGDIPSLRDQWRAVQSATRFDLELRMKQQSAFVERLLCGGVASPAHGSKGPSGSGNVRFRPLRVSRRRSRAIDSLHYNWQAGGIQGLSGIEKADPPLDKNGAGSTSCEDESTPKDSAEAAPHDLGVFSSSTPSQTARVQSGESSSRKTVTAVSSKLALNLTRTQHTGAKPAKKQRSRVFENEKLQTHFDNEKLSPTLKALAGIPGARFVATTCFQFASWYNDLKEPPRSGRLAALVDSSRFQTLCMFVIFTNAVTSAYSADWSARNRVADLSKELWIFDLGFISFYTIELILKMVVHRLYFFHGQELGWNIFDLMLVVTGVLEELLASGDNGKNLMFLRSIRIMKITRLLRVLRVVKALQELKLMLFSILGSLRQLFWCIVLIMFLLLIFGLYFLQELNSYVIDNLDEMPTEEKDRIDRFFGSLSDSMTTLFMATTGGTDWEGMYRMISLCGWSGEMMFLMYIAFFNIAVINVLTGLFVEQAIKISKMDREELVREQRMKELGDAKHLRKLCEEMDVDGSGAISWEELSVKLRDEKVLTYLAAIGLELHDCDVFFQMLCSVSGQNEVDIDVFVRGCMRMKGGASGLDMQAMAYELKLIRQSQADLADDLDVFFSMQSVASRSSLTKEQASPRLTATQTQHSDSAPGGIPVNVDSRSGFSL